MQSLISYLKENTQVFHYLEVSEISDFNFGDFVDKLPSSVMIGPLTIYIHKFQFEFINYIVK